MKETFSKIWKFSRDRHTEMIKGLIFSFLRSACGITQLMAIILAIQVLTKEAEVSHAVFQIVILTIVCVLGNFLTSYIEQIQTMESGFFMVGDIRVSVGNLLKKVPLGFFNQSSSGKVTSTLTTTLSGVESAAAMVMAGIISGLFSALMLFVFMLFYEYRIGIVAGIGMAVYLLVVGWQMKLSRRHAPALQTAQTHLSEAAFNFLKGIKVTKAFSFQKGDTALKKAISDSCDANITLTNQSMGSQFAAGLTIAVFESVLLTLSLVFYFVTEELSLVQVIVLMLFSFMVYASLNQAGSMLSMIGLLDAGLSEAEELEQAKQMETEVPEQTAASCEIIFDHVSFSYGKNEVLHDISAVIRPHTLTAVIGPSGSGKTTMCQLIPRFHDVSSGSISIGGADIRHMPSEELMKKISMVFQDVYLFEDTILNNIRFGRPDATEEEVIAAAKAARCDAFISALPQGYQTMIGESGNSLSGGEKQRISIARAMLKDAPIIILDEATSALDAENEHEILAAMDELTQNKTVIMIAHRLSTVRKADQILAVRDGCIVQAGTHEELLCQKGLYADFLTAREKASGWNLSR